jgi:hypothetical protein
MRRHLTYANVIATLALFLALGGGAVWAATKFRPGKLRPSSVSAGKIKRNAVTASKIRPGAVTAAKIRPGAVDFAKLAAGTNLLASATAAPVGIASSDPVTVGLQGTTTFAANANTLDLLSVEARGTNLGRVSNEECRATIVPFLNGSQWSGGNPIAVSSFIPTATAPTGLIPLSGATGPIGLTSPGVAQTVSVRVFGDPDCVPQATVTVAVAVTQAK